MIAIIEPHQLIDEQIKGGKFYMPVYDKQANQMWLNTLVYFWFKVRILIQVGHVLGNERTHRFWPWWISCINVFWKSEWHQLLCIFWQFLHLSQTNDTVVRKCHLCEKKWYQTVNACHLWNQTSKWNMVSMIGKHAKLCLLRNGWATNLSSCY